MAGDFPTGVLDYWYGWISCFDGYSLNLQTVQITCLTSISDACRKLPSVLRILVICIQHQTSCLATSELGSHFLSIQRTTYVGTSFIKHFSRLFRTFPAFFTSYLSQLEWLHFRGTAKICSLKPDSNNQIGEVKHFFLRWFAMQPLCNIKWLTCVAVQC